MMSLQQILDNPIVLRIGFAIMHSLWQCTVIAVLFAVVMVALRNRRAQVRYNVAVSALLLMVVAAAVTVFVARGVEKAEHAAVKPMPVAAPVLEQPAKVFKGGELPLVETAAVFPEEQLALVEDASEKAPAVANTAGIREKIETVLPYLAIGWVIGVLVLSVWHLGGWAQLRRLRRVMVKPVEDHIADKLARLASSLAVTRTIEIVESALVTVPTVIGALKPVILLPASALTGLSAEQLEMILAHELAHIKRNDYLVNLIQTAVDILLFYHPAAWYVSRKIRAERENCCDDIAVRVTGDSLKYARALTTMEQIKATNQRLAVAANGGNFFDRIARLVGKEDSRKSKPAWQTAVITMLVIAVITIPAVVAMSQNSQMITGDAEIADVFDDSDESEEDVETSKLSFRLICHQGELDGVRSPFWGSNIKRSVEQFYQKGPDAVGDYLKWLPVNDLVPDWALVKEYKGKKYVLLTNGDGVGHNYALVEAKEKSRHWGLVDVKAIKNNKGTFDIAYELDDNASDLAGRKMYDYKSSHVAVLIDDSVVSVFKMDKPIPSKGIIRCGFDEQNAKEYAVRLKAGMPASANLHRLITQSGSFSKEGKPHVALNDIKRLVDRNDRLLHTTFDPHQRPDERPDTYMSKVIAYSGRKDIIEYMLDKGVKINETGRNGQTALHTAVERNKIDIIKLLLDRGSDINALDERGMTPLSAAIFGDYSEDTVMDRFKLLLKRGADINAKGNSGLSPVTLAILKKGIFSFRLKDEVDEYRKLKFQKNINELSQIIELLLSKNVKRDIFTASGLGDLKAIKAILKTDPSVVNISGAYGFKPLHLAVMTNQKAAAKLLLEKGAGLNDKSELGTPVEVAASCGDLDMFKTLEKHLRGLGGKYSYGKEVLFEAGKCGHAEIVAHILDNGWNLKLDTVGDGDSTLLCRAAVNGRLEVAKLLIDRKANVNYKTKRGITPLIQAARWGVIRCRANDKRVQHIETIKLLLKSGADVNAVDIKNETALLAASAAMGQFSYDGTNEIVKLLIDGGADVNIARKDNYETALAFAVRANDYERVKMLLEAGADPFLAVGFKHQKRLPIEMAKQRKDLEKVVKLLEKYMAPRAKKTNKSIKAVLSKCLKAIAANDNDTLLKYAMDLNEYGNKQWVEFAKRLRKQYKGHYDLFDDIEPGLFMGGWADAFIKLPAGDKNKYTMFTLMQMPDRSWRVVQYSSRRENRPGDGARTAIGFNDDFRKKIFDDSNDSVEETKDVAKSTLQKMIDDAKPNSTVTVPKGIYAKMVKISKPLTLKGSGDGDCIIEVSANSPAIFIDTKGKGDVVVEGLTIKWKLATSDRIDYASAVAVKDCKATIKNCVFMPLGNFRQSPTAARAYGFSKMYLDNCKFEGFDYTVCYSEATEGAMTNCMITKCKSQGVILYSGASVDVIGNYITNSGKHAVRSTGGKLNMLDNLIVNNANRGVYLGNKTGSGTIANNVLIGNGVGISGFASANVIVENNVILKSQYTAIAMRGSCRLKIKDNIIKDNPTGVIVYSDNGENNNTLLQNTFYNNKETTKDIKAPANTITADPLFNDAKNGDFSLKPGKAQESKQGLTNPKVISDLWNKNHKTPSPAKVDLPTARDGFSAVKEFVIQKDGHFGMNLDFDSGKTFSMPADMRANNDPQELMAWVSNTGVDASVKVKGSRCYIGLTDSFAVQVDNKKWQTITPQEISGNSELVQEPLNYANITKKLDDLPRTYIFKTRQKGMGIFQVSNFKGTPVGVKITFRLIERS